MAVCPDHISTARIFGRCSSVLEFYFAWTFPSTHVCLSLTSYPKATGLPVELLGQALEHMQRHAQSIPIYTDGSKSASRVGCTAVFSDFEMFVSLPLMATIFTAELCAIFLALTQISTHNDSSFIVHSDSSSALHALGRLYTRHALVLKIQRRFLAGLHSQRRFLLLDPIPCGTAWH